MDHDRFPFPTDVAAASAECGSDFEWIEFAPTELPQRFHFRVAVPRPMSPVPPAEPAGWTRPLSRFVCSRHDHVELEVSALALQHDVHPADVVAIEDASRGRKVLDERTYRSPNGLVTDRLAFDGSTRRVVRSTCAKNGDVVLVASMSAPAERYAACAHEALLTAVSFTAAETEQPSRAEGTSAHALHGPIPFHCSAPASWKRVEAAATHQGELVLEARHESTCAGRIEAWFDRRAADAVDSLQRAVERLETRGFRFAGSRVTPVEIQSHTAHYSSGLACFENQRFDSTMVAIPCETAPLVLTATHAARTESEYWWAVGRRAFDHVLNSWSVQEGAS